MRDKPINRPELLAPAGDAEKLLFAFQYGADAAYIGGGNFSLRAHAGNFSLAQMRDGVNLAHALGKKLYVAVNIFATNQDMKVLPAYLEQLAELQPDALIISDPGVLLLAQKYAPTMAIHISTQANNLNTESAHFWANNGAKRIVLGRDISLAEAAEIAAAGYLETEVFVHGAMCVAYSGRCLLSSYLTGRSANQGDCAQPCRWKYALLEEKRPGVYLPIEEDQRGSYIMNAKDLCLIETIPDLMMAGHAAWKIEGRNKSAYYTANISRIYRAAMDCYLMNPEQFTVTPHWRRELSAISHRQYTEAFALQRPDENAYRYASADYLRGYDFAAIVRDCQDGCLWLEQRNHLAVGDILEILLPDGDNISLPLTNIYDQQGNRIMEAPHPKQLIRIDADIAKLPCLPLIARRLSK
ncbi:MAG: U32 family peptidase [Clostridiales bacterium]